MTDAVVTPLRHKWTVVLSVDDHEPHKWQGYAATARAAVRRAKRHAHNNNHTVLGVALVRDLGRVSYVSHKPPPP